ncbi:MAG: hypothetical protein AB7F66_00230 [Bacteriovoracia bacterium]
MTKTQLRCYSCRRAVHAQDGQWHPDGNQQVFRCHTCDKAQTEAAKKSMNAKVRIHG